MIVTHFVDPLEVRLCYDVTTTHFEAVHVRDAVL
jgi:hypothetical protein